jgi:hypothetical protein
MGTSFGVILPKYYMYFMFVMFSPSPHINWESSVSTYTFCVLVERAVRRSRAWTVFARPNTEVVGSNPTRGMDVCLSSFCVHVVLATGWSLIQGVLPTVCKIKKVTRKWNEESQSMPYALEGATGTWIRFASRFPILGFGSEERSPTDMWICSSWSVFGLQKEPLLHIVTLLTDSPRPVLWKGTGGNIVYIVPSTVIKTTKQEDVHISPYQKSKVP